VIRLRTFGEAIIELGSTRISPAWERGFALALYLAVERERRVTRGVLQTLLFPRAESSNAAHSVRQLLYRLRQVGYPVLSHADSVWVNESAVEDDFRELLAAQHLTPSQFDRISGGFLRGYDPTFSQPFAEWCDELRSLIGMRLQHRITSQLAELRVSGDWVLAERAARASLAIDPFNEEGTLSLAESLAMSGSKMQAIQLLDRFINEVGSANSDLSIPATLLRRRICDRLKSRNGGPHMDGVSPLIGRALEMQTALHRLRLAKDGRPQVLVLEGPPGIGKSRVAEEVLKNGHLQGFVSAAYACREFERLRPLGALSSLITALLSLPGSLGADPSSLRVLQRLSGAELVQEQTFRNSDILAAETSRALRDTLGAICQEAPLVLLLEDCQWLDVDSQQILLQAAAVQHERVLLLMTTRDDRISRDLPQYSRTACEYVAIQLAPLSDAHARILAESSLRSSDCPSDTLIDWCVQSAGGNPLFVIELARHQKSGAATFCVPSSLRDLIRDRIKALPDSMQVILCTIALLQPFCSPSLLAATTELPTYLLAESLQRLESEGFVSYSEDRILCTHGIVSEVALSAQGSAAKASLAVTAAKSLSVVARRESDTSASWRAAELFALGGAAHASVQAFRRCARSAMREGIPAAAVSSFDQALRVSRDHSEQRELLIERVGAADAAGDLDAIFSSVETLSATDEDLVKSTPNVYLAFSTARFVTGKGIASQKEQLFSIASDARCSILERLRAVRLLLINAEHSLSRCDAHRAYALTKEFPTQSSGTEAVQHQLVEVVYHTTFGDLSRALNAADALVPAGWHTRRSLDGDRAVGNAAFAYYRLGAVSKARELLQLLFRRATQAGSLIEAHRSAAMLGTVALDLGELSEAENWILRAEEVLHSTTNAYFVGGHVSNKVKLSILLGDSGLAEKYLVEALERFPITQCGRDRLIAKAFSLRINQLRGQFELSPADLRRLVAEHRRARRYGMHDEFMIVTWRGLCMNGQCLEGTKLLNAYLQLHRRDRYPVPKELACA
jgi:DNA-binding SARP family transcriptional activator/tetratricopeptide (TPR) repeat protein